MEKIQREIIIRPEQPWWEIDSRELWSYRELFYVFVWRDIIVRYKQTVVGIAWVVFQPLVTTGIFSVFFGKIAKIPSDNLPYPLFVLIGMVIWGFFSSGVSSGSQSLITNEGILKKVYFPRLIIPLSAILTSGFDFLISLVLVLFALIFYGYFPGLSFIFWMPVFILILMLTISGLAMFTSALNVKYRDVRYVLPFFIQIGLFLSPIIYPLSVIYDYRKYFLIINPLTGVVEGVRAVISNQPVNLEVLFIGLSVSIVVFLFGLFYFRETERFFADIA